MVGNDGGERKVRMEFVFFLLVIRFWLGFLWGVLGSNFIFWGILIVFSCLGFFFRRFCLG